MKFKPELPQYQQNNITSYKWLEEIASVLYDWCAIQLVVDTEYSNKFAYV